MNLNNIKKRLHFFTIPLLLMSCGTSAEKAITLDSQKHTLLTEYCSIYVQQTNPFRGELNIELLESLESNDFRVSISGDVNETDGHIELTFGSMNIYQKPYQFILEEAEKANFTLSASEIPTLDQIKHYEKNVGMSGTLVNKQTFTIHSPAMSDLMGNNVALAKDAELVEQQVAFECQEVDYLFSNMQYTNSIVN